jgi:hypothetical protein
MSNGQMGEAKGTYLVKIYNSNFAVTKKVVVEKR